jgi:hypothetical protein
LIVKPAVRIGRIASSGSPEGVAVMTPNETQH